MLGNKRGGFCQGTLKPPFRINYYLHGDLKKKTEYMNHLDHVCRGALRKEGQ